MSMRATETAEDFGCVGLGLQLKAGQLRTMLAKKVVNDLF